MKTQAPSLPSESSSYLFPFSFLKTKFHCAVQAGLELTEEPRQASNSRSCFHCAVAVGLGLLGVEFEIILDL